MKLSLLVFFQLGSVTVIAEESAESEHEERVFHEGSLAEFTDALNFTDVAFPVDDGDDDDDDDDNDDDNDVEIPKLEQQEQSQHALEQPQGLQQQQGLEQHHPERGHDGGVVTLQRPGHHEDSQLKQFEPETSADGPQDKVHSHIKVNMPLAGDSAKVAPVATLIDSSDVSGGSDGIFEKYAHERLTSAEHENAELRKLLLKAEMYEGSLISKIEDLTRKAAEVPAMEHNVRKLLVRRAREEEHVKDEEARVLHLKTQLRNASDVADAKATTLSSVESQLDSLSGQNKRITLSVRKASADYDSLSARLFETNRTHFALERSLHANASKLRRTFAVARKAESVMERKVNKLMAVTARQEKRQKADEARMRDVQLQIRNSSRVANDEEAALLSVRSHLDSVQKENTDLKSLMENETKKHRLLSAEISESHRNHLAREASLQNDTAELLRNLKSAKHAARMSESRKQFIESRVASAANQESFDRKREHALQDEVAKAREEIAQIRGQLATEKERGSGFREFAKRLQERIKESELNVTREVTVRRQMTNKIQEDQRAVTLFRQRVAESNHRRQQERKVILNMKERLAKAQSEISKMRSSQPFLAKKEADQEDEVRDAEAKARAAEEQRDVEHALLNESKHRISDMEEQYMRVVQELGWTYGQNDGGSAATLTRNSPGTTADEVLATTAVVADDETESGESTGFAAETSVPSRNTDSEVGSSLPLAKTPPVQADEMSIMAAVSDATAGSW
eukprot:TRINITY_DN20120_c0_g1_i1.p1 TRINITY_DN20120_c0_g1~~TRINITY_DN20120_c0_g1_i1.p1  ORF type:complete len:745 (-),score=182.85 TRINITY_DN20120_c0_g1_i1:357-2591(-)